MLFCSNSAPFSEIQFMCDGWTDRRTDGPTDIPFYRDVRAHLKSRVVSMLDNISCSFTFLEGQELLFFYHSPLGQKKRRVISVDAHLVPGGVTINDVIPMRIILCRLCVFNPEVLRWTNVRILSIRGRTY